MAANLINKLSFNTIGLIAEELGVESDPANAVYDLKNLGDSAEISLTTFLNQLNEIGRFQNITCLENRTSIEDFRAFLEYGVFPFIVIPDLKAFTPLVITGMQGDKLAGYYIHEQDRSYVELTADELIRLLPTFIEQTTPNHNIVTFITPLLVKSFVSNPKEQTQGHHLTPLQRFWFLLKSEQRDIWHLYIFAIIIGLLSLATPLGVQAIINLISGGLFLQPIIVLISFVIAATIASGLIQVLQIHIVENLKQKIFARGAFEFAFRIPKIKFEALSKEYAPELMNRFFDIITIQKSFTKLLIDFLVSIVQILFGLLLLAFYHPFFVFFGLILIGLVTAMFLLAGPPGIKTSLQESKYKYKVAHWLEEIARTLLTFKLAGYTNLSLAKTDEHVSFYLKKRKAHFRILVAQYMSIVVFKTLITATVLILGSVLVIDKQITLGQFVASEIVILSIFVAVEKIILNLDTVYDILTAVDKIGHVTDIPLDKKGGLTLNTGKRGFSIATQNMAYKYPDSDVYTLKNITFSIQSGERVGIVGKSGSGKSTLIQVICALLESYEGAITFDGVSLKDINITALRDDIGENLGNDEIFDGTIEENITVGKAEVSLHDVYHAVSVVGLEEFVQNAPQGLQTPLVSGGKQLPHTVIKKLILARSIAENPRLVVFDEFFETIDLHFQRKIIDYMFDKSNLWTLIAISQNPYVLYKCDKIIVLEDGTVKRIVTFEELIKDPDFSMLLPIYKDGKLIV